VRPRLIALTCRRLLGAERTLERFRELGRLARAGSVVLSLRDLELPVRERLAFGEAMKRVARETSQPFVVNDRLDLAMLLGADGVHLGEAGVATVDARRLLSPHALVVRACHDPALALRLDADIVLLSPILAPRKGRPALGLEALGMARRAYGTNGGPLLFALGGMDAERARACLEAGADGVAAMGGVLGAGDLEPFVRALGIRR
jgi:thiamine-phosphate pyrophosphorylase